LEEGYWRAYDSFYRWSAILRGAAAKPSLLGRLRHIAYAGGWKKLEPLWDLVIRAKRVGAMLPVLETVLDRGRTGRQADPSNETQRGILAQVDLHEESLAPRD
jgi:hypothetical protein